MCSHTRRLGLISPDATWAASSSRIAAELIEAARRGGADFAVDVYPYYGSDVEATLRAGYDLRHGLTSRLETSSSMTTSMVLYSRFVDAYSPLTWVDAFFSWNVPV